MLSGKFLFNMYVHCCWKYRRCIRGDISCHKWLCLIVLSVTEFLSLPWKFVHRTHIKILFRDKFNPLCACGFRLRRNFTDHLIWNTGIESLSWCTSSANCWGSGASQGIPSAALGIFGKQCPWLPPPKIFGGKTWWIHQKLFWDILMQGR